MIEVKRIGAGDPIEFAVAVTSGGTATRHEMTMFAADCERLAPRHAPEQVIEAAFRFLLDREPKESIVSRFDVTVIGRYFPEFERNLAQYLAL